MNTNIVYPMSQTAPNLLGSIYYKLICIDQEHAKIADLQIKHSGLDAIKSAVLGRALVVKIDKEGLDQKSMADINYLLSCVRVNAMAYDDTLTGYDKEEINKGSTL